MNFSIRTKLYPLTKLTGGGDTIDVEGENHVSTIE